MGDHTSVCVSEIIERLEGDVAIRISNDGTYLQNDFNLEFAWIISRNIRHLLKKRYGHRGISEFYCFLAKNKIKIARSMLYQYIPVDENDRPSAVIPIGIIMAFCEFYDNYPIEKLVDADRSEVDDKKADSPLKSLLDSVFGNNKNYVYDTERHGIYFNCLLDRTYNSYIPPISTPLQGSASHNILKGKLSFRNGDGNICEVVLKTEHTAIKHEDVQYSGFAMILEPNTKNGTCWCFLKQVGDEDADLFAICFRLRTSEVDVENIHKLDVRLAEVLTLSAHKARPTIMRLLLTTIPIDSKHYEHISYLLRLNGKKLYITKNYFDKINSHSDNDELLRALNKINSKIKSIGEVLSIESIDVENTNNLDLLKMLRSNSLSESYNKVSDKAERATYDIVTELTKK